MKGCSLVPVAHGQISAGAPLGPPGRAGAPGQVGTPLVVPREEALSLGEGAAVGGDLHLQALPPCRLPSEQPR